VGGCSDPTILSSAVMSGYGRGCSHEIEQDVCGDLVRAPSAWSCASCRAASPNPKCIQSSRGSVATWRSRCAVLCSRQWHVSCCVVLRDRRHDILRAQAFDVFFDVVGLVHACGDGLSRRRVLGQHVFGRLPFCRASCLRHDTLAGEAVSVLHRGVPHVAERALLAL
jgi:hypothetical protein